MEQAQAQLNKSKTESARTFAPIESSIYSDAALHFKDDSFHFSHESIAELVMSQQIANEFYFHFEVIEVCIIMCSVIHVKVIQLKQMF